MTTRTLQEATQIVNTLLNAFRRQKFELIMKRRDGSTTYEEYEHAYRQVKGKMILEVVSIMESVSWEDQISLAARFPDIGYLEETLDPVQLSSLKILM